MPKKIEKKSATSSWWNERSKILAKKTETKPAKTKKAGKAEKGKTYYCEVCGCQLICVEPSAEEIVCCDQPMCLVC